MRWSYQDVFLKIFLQETFWRIPGSLSHDQLRQMADSIEPQEGVALSAAERKKKSNPRYDSLKEMARTRRQEKKGGKKRRDRREEVPVTEVVSRVMDDEDNEEDSEDETGTRLPTLPTTSSAHKRGRVKRALQSDSSDDDRLVSFLIIKALDTLGSCQRPVFPYAYKTNLWKFCLNWSSKLQGVMKEKSPLLHKCLWYM